MKNLMQGASGLLLKGGGLVLVACLSFMAFTASPDDPDSAEAAVPATVADDAAQADVPASADDATTTVITEDEDGEPVVLAATNMALALQPTYCGGTGEAWYLDNPNAFDASMLDAAYDERPEYAKNDEEFMRSERGFGHEQIFELLVTHGRLNGNMVNRGFVPESVLDNYVARLHAVPGGLLSDEPRTLQNFTCEGDVISENGTLTFREDGKFSDSAGFVIERTILEAKLLELGMTYESLPVYVAMLNKDLNGDGVVDEEEAKQPDLVYVEDRAVGCLNHVRKLPPGSPPPMVPPTTTVPPTTVPPETTAPTTVPPPDTTVPETSTTLVTTTTVPETTTTVPDTTSSTTSTTVVTTTTVPETTSTTSTTTTVPDTTSTTSTSTTSTTSTTTTIPVTTTTVCEPSKCSPPTTLAPPPTTIPVPTTVVSTTVPPTVPPDTAPPDITVLDPDPSVVPTVHTGAPNTTQPSSTVAPAPTSPVSTVVEGPSPTVD